MLGLWFALISSTFSFSAQAAVDRLYDNASDGSPAIGLIRSARQSLDLEIYTMKDQTVASEILAALKRGVRVRIIQAANPVMDNCPVFKPNVPGTTPDCLALRALVARVNQGGGKYIPFSYELCGTPGSFCYQHGKLIIQDKTTAMISTGNLDPSNLCDIPELPAHCNRDFSVVTTDKDVTVALNQIFEKDLVGQAYDLGSVLRGSPRLTASPLSLNPLVNFINSATKTIQIHNQYLYDSDLNNALMAAAKRGVKVFVMVASVSAFGKMNPTADLTKIQRWTTSFQAFDAAGVRSKIFDDHMTINGQPGYLHAKAILVDSARAWVGSVNGSIQSLTQNREYGLFSNDPTLVKHLGEIMYADFANRNAETWKQSLVCFADSCWSSQPEPDPVNEESSMNFSTELSFQD